MKNLTEATKRTQKILWKEIGKVLIKIYRGDLKRRWRLRHFVHTQPWEKQKPDVLTFRRPWAFKPEGCITGRWTSERSEISEIDRT